MKQKVMDAMQSFARALMGPVLFLPIAGMLQAISSVMSNTALVTEGGVVWTLGKFINGGVSAVIGNLGILFCVGIAMSLAKKRKADAAFLALVSYLVWLAANSRWLDVAGLTIAGDTASALYGTGQTICLGYHVTDMGVFLGMILGVVVALVHNRFIDTEFEGAMAIYNEGGKRGLMENINAALPFMDEDMRELAKRTLAKIAPLTENEYTELAIFAADEV